MNASRDQLMADAGDENDESRLPLSQDEEKVLELYDKLRELQLEIAIINAQNAQPPESQSDTIIDEATVARGELLESRAQYLLRNRVVDAVLSANPILKAVHNGTDASPVERDLLGYVEKRDAASISVAQLAAANSDVREESARAQGEALRASRANVALAAEVMELAAQVAANKAGRAGDARSQQDFARLEAELKRSRQRWRVLKGLTSGVVVGSGINWMEDEKLCALVLDPDNED